LVTSSCLLMHTSFLIYSWYLCFIYLPTDYLLYLLTYEITENKLLCIEGEKLIEETLRRQVLNHLPTTFVKKKARKSKTTFSSIKSVIKV
jgi:hypothetical protein